MASPQTPLSPFMQYKPQLTSVLSITHRGTGIFLSLGAILLCYWLISIAAGPEIYVMANTHISAWYGQFVLICFVFSLYYHLCNGIRHLFWDLVLGLEIDTTYRSGYVVVIVSILLTVVTVYVRSLA